MTKATSFVAIFLVGAMALFLGEFLVTAQVKCNVMELSSCVPAISSSTPPPPSPTQKCCAKLKEQEPCFCDFLKNPLAKPYVNSTRAQEVLAICGVTFPQCQDFDAHTQKNLIDDDRNTSQNGLNTIIYMSVVLHKIC